MSNQWLNIAFADRRAKNGARLMLFVLADRADDNGVSFYGVETLMEKTNLGLSAAHNALRELVKLGLLQVEYKKGPRGCNVYHLLPTLRNLHGAESAPCGIQQGTLRNLHKDPAESGPNPSGIPQDPSFLSPVPPSPAASGAGAGKGSKKVKAKKQLKAKQPAAEKPTDPRFKPVTDGYCTTYSEVVGDPYIHNGGRDGKQLKRLLATAKPAVFTVERIVRIIRAAMERGKDPYSKACKHASTIHGFCDHFNDIRAELNEARASTRTRKAKADPTPEQVAAWLETRPEYASKRDEWTSYDDLPPFARDELHQHQRQDKQPAATHA